MIIGKLSLDPRNILFAQIQRDDAGWYLAVTYKVGDAGTEIDVRGETEELEAWLARLDDRAYKGPLADAVATDSIDDGDIDDLTITDRLIEGCR
jgi:hypothetical protein